jgi:prevent-host-death family protein
LTNFKRNSSDVIEQLKTTGQPMVLTVNGKAEVVVQDAKTYEAVGSCRSGGSGRWDSQRSQIDAQWPRHPGRRSL